MFNSNKESNKDFLNEDNSKKTTSKIVLNYMKKTQKNNQTRQFSLRIHENLYDKLKIYSDNIKKESINTVISNLIEKLMLEKEKEIKEFYDLIIKNEITKGEKNV